MPQAGPKKQNIIIVVVVTTISMDAEDPLT